MTSLPNLAQQLNYAAQTDGLGPRFFLCLLEKSSPETLHALSKTLHGDSQMVECCGGV